MWRLAWDFFLSFTIRAVFTLALVGGVCFVIWTYLSWRGGQWNDQPNLAWAALVLAGVTTLVGLAGTFRAGRAEARFSLFAVAGIVAGAGAGQVHVGPQFGGRTLRRFPSLESFILGALLIAVWGVVMIARTAAWPFHAAALVGVAQILWGVGLEVFGGRRTAVETETPPDGTAGA